MLNFSRTVLGIELGTTRIKAVLLDENHAPVASGSHVWENRLENGIWTYSLEDIVGGVQSCMPICAPISGKEPRKIRRHSAPSAYLP